MTLYKHIFSLFISLSLFGYPLSAGISELLSINPKLSLISIIFRSITVSLSFFLILNLLYKKIIKNKRELFILMILFGMYMLRLAYDLEIIGVVVYEGAPNFYLFFYFTVALPSILILAHHHMFDSVDDFLYYFKPVLYLSLFLNLYFGFNGYLNSIINGMIMSRLETNKLNPISLGHLSATILIYLIFIKQYLKKKFHLIDNIALIGAFVGLIMSNSKNPILTLLLVILFAYYLQYGLQKKFYLAIFLLLLSVVISYILFVNVFDINVFQRFSIMFSEDDESSMSRMSSFKEGIEMFLSNPVFGKSFLLPLGGYPHNILIDLLMSLGLIGFSIFIYLSIKTFRAIILIQRMKQEFVIIGLLFIQYFIAAQTSGTFWDSSYIFIFMSLILAAKNSLIRK